MTESSAIPPDATEAVGAVIRSFTEAEVALRELLAAAATFRSASDDLNVGRDELTIARTALVEMAEGFTPLIVAVTVGATQLRETAEGLRAIDQQRIWDEFAATGSALTAAEAAAAGRAETTNGAVMAAADTVTSRIATLETGLAAAVAQSTTLTATNITTGVATVTGRVAEAQAALEGATRSVAASLDRSTGLISDRVSQARSALDASSKETAANLEQRLDRLAKRTDYVLAVAVVATVLSAVALVAGLLK